MPNDGKQLKKFLERENITQAEFAQMLDVKQPVISKYISGLLDVPLDVIKFLHRKYQMSYEWFFEGIGSMKVKEVDKKNLVSDLNDLRDTLSVLQHKVVKMDRDFKKLHAEYHAKSV